jgi:ribosome modulation factor
MDAIDLRVISDRSKEKCCSTVLAVARMYVGSWDGQMADGVSVRY